MQIYGESLGITDIFDYQMGLRKFRKAPFIKALHGIDSASYNMPRVTRTQHLCIYNKYIEMINASKIN